MSRQRTILHSDMNSCYASIALLYHPELRGYHGLVEAKGVS